MKYHKDLNIKDQQLFEFIVEFCEKSNLLKQILDDEEKCDHIKILGELQRINILSDLYHCVSKMNNFFEQIVKNHDCSEKIDKPNDCVKTYIAENDKSIN